MLVALVLASCSNRADTAARPDPAASSWPATCTVEGTILAIVGPIPNSHLARVDLCHLTSEWAVKATGVFEVASDGADIIVSGTHPFRPGGPPSGVQRLSKLVDGRFDPIDGLVEGREASPAITPDGDVLFLSPKEDGRMLLMRYSRSTGKTDIVYDLAPGNENLGAVAVAQDGRVALERRSARLGRYKLLILEIGGKPKEIDLAFGGEGSWGKGSLIAVSPGSDSWRTALVDPDSGEVQVVEGWRSLDWSPGGELLLYQREDSVLGVAKAATPTEIEPIGKLKDGTVYDAAWLE